MITRFQVGKTYICKSVCDVNAKWQYTVTARTGKTIIILDESGSVGRLRVTATSDEEIAYPDGKYSMCPVLRAGSEVTK